MRVLRLLKVRETVLPARVPCKEAGILPDLIACLKMNALRTSVANSSGVTSAADRKCRGANGDVGGVEIEELARTNCFAMGFAIRKLERREAILGSSGGFPMVWNELSWS